MANCPLCGTMLRAGTRGDQLKDGAVLCVDCCKKAQIRFIGRYYTLEDVKADLELTTEELNEKRKKEAENDYEIFRKPPETPYDNKNIIDMTFDTPVYKKKGARGRSIYVYKDYVLLENNWKAADASLLTGTATDGIKLIFFKDVIGIQFKPPGMTIGYLQLETASDLMDKGKSNFFNENTFTFETDNEGTKEIVEMYKYIIKRVAEEKGAQTTDIKE